MTQEHIELKAKVESMENMIGQAMQKPVKSRKKAS